jgi:hypothetical protein
MESGTLFPQLKTWAIIAACVIAEMSMMLSDGKSILKNILTF